MEFKLPDIGEGVHEGEITRWLVQPGQKIEADQPMVEVMTDKATVEIPSPVSGTVENLMFKEGETVEVGKVLLKISENGKAAPAPKVAAAPASAASYGAAGHTAPAQGASKSAHPTSSQTVSSSAPSSAGHSSMHAAAEPPRVEPEVPFHVLATPATRKLARDLRIDLGGVPGSGPNGRVTKEDVQLAFEGQQAAQVRPSHPAPQQALATKQALGGAPASQNKMPVPASRIPTVSRGAIERIPLKGIRKKIAESMSHSKRTAAHFTYVEEVDMTLVAQMRKAAAPEAEKRGVKLTFLPFVIKALIPCLKEFPMLNSSLDDEKQEIIVKGDYNIGIATDTPNGLMVPVIKNADSLSIWELAAVITELSDRARIMKSSIDDLKGGTFTITNAGSIGGVFATPVINHPEVAILGVNAIRKRPVVVDDEIVIRDMMFFSISVDHRVVDGADAARFMNRLVYFLNEPSRLVFA
jgi:pyruvate dehydrogenase E2 component (dihydrolipoamide acetyltransferase)